MSSLLETITKFVSENQKGGKLPTASEISTVLAATLKTVDLENRSQSEKEFKSVSDALPDGKRSGAHRNSGIHVQVNLVSSFKTTSVFGDLYITWDSILHSVISFFFLVYVLWNEVWYFRMGVETVSRCYMFFLTRNWIYMGSYLLTPDSGRKHLRVEKMGYWGPQELHSPPTTRYLISETEQRIYWKATQIAERPAHKYEGFTLHHYPGVRPGLQVEVSACDLLAWKVEGLIMHRSVYYGRF